MQAKITYGQLADMVLASARKAANRYDRHHAYVSRIHADLYPALGMPLEVFKSALLAMHKATYSGVEGSDFGVTLSRADFVEAMDMGAVKSSEIRHHSATFHFVTL